MYAVGIDISKGKSTVAITDSTGNLVQKVFEVHHNQTGIQDFLSYLDSFSSKEMKIVMEATSHYHFPLLFALQKHGLFVSVENALVIKKYCDTDLRRAKNDKKDAVKLASYCREKWLKIKAFQPQDSVRNDLLFLSREYSKYVQMQSRLKIHMNDLIDKTFCGLKEAVNAESRYHLLLNIYEKYWHPEIVLKINREDFIVDINTMAKILGHRIGTKIGETIYDLAPSVVTLRPNDCFTQLAATNCVQLIRQAIKSTDTIISKMDELAMTLPEFQTVNAMNGAGPKTRARLIAEIGDIRRFRNASCLVAFCGIDTPPYQSGNFQASERHITKRGNKYLRKVGYEIMRNLKSSRPKQDNAVYKYIVQKELEGKAKKSAKIAGLNKFLRIYYARVMEVYSSIQ